MTPGQAQQQSAMANALRGAGQQPPINPVPAQGPQGPQGQQGPPGQGMPQQQQAQQPIDPRLKKRLMTGGTPPL